MTLTQRTQQCRHAPEAGCLRRKQRSSKGVFHACSSFTGIAFHRGIPRIPPYRALALLISPRRPAPQCVGALQ